MSHRNVPPRALLLCAAVALASLVSRDARAQEACEDISGGAPIIYGAGGSAQRDLIGKAAVLLQSSDSPVYVVYNDTEGGCSGLYAMTGLGSANITGTGYYWDELGTRLTCTLPLTGAPVQFGAQAIGPLTCPLVTDPALVADFVDAVGPISAFNVVVQIGSSQQAISSEAFYLIYGLGAPAADISPWNLSDPSYVISRNDSSAAAQVFSVASTLPSSKFLNFGVDAGSNSNSIALLVALADAEAGLAFVAADVADANRATSRTLAWQQTGQNVAYWPDSSATTFDKANVRNGQYNLWNPGHFLAPGDAATGIADNPDVQVLLDYMSGAAQPAGTTTTITETAVANKNIPWCAMRVNREGDVGPVYSWAPSEPCGCYYDFQTTGATTCAACDTNNNPCSGTDVCRFGYCEAN